VGGIKQRTEVSHYVRHFSFPSALASKLATLPETKNAPIGALLFFVWRRERDSNPRTCNSQQFSRLPQSTALPSLRRKSSISTYSSKKNDGKYFISALYA
jgi:hypothetical protein